VNDLYDRAQRWLKHDPDPHAKAELEELLTRAREGDDEAHRHLTDRFAGPLEFGTAGLRGVIGAGESRMNRAVVLRTTLGFARYLLEVDADGARKKGIIVGYDARIMSQEFAEDAAAVLCAAGIPAYLAEGPCPTPLTAFAVTHMGTAGGIMITASHNPPEYNGYKVYWKNGAQIIPPHDKGIARAIEAAPPADEVERLSRQQARERKLWNALPPEVEQSYMAAIAKLSVRDDGERSMRIVYTPLHGVGERLTRRALTQAGFTAVSSVAEQAEPDGAFPTVAFPNPEEKGALDLAFALAEREGADLILANDPDVDRLAAAVRAPTGKFVQLTGNQVGALLGHYLLTEGPNATGDRLVLASCVSSPMLGTIARKLGVRYEETLTGFKWIANRAMELEASTGVRFVFGFEEALGYTVGDVVRDKDGISAAVLLAELAAVRRAAGTSLLDELETLARRYGLFVSGQRSVTLPGADGLARIAATMKRLRAASPQSIGGHEVIAIVDYQAQTRTVRGAAPTALNLPPSNVLGLELDGGSRIIARPSGTEPKIKFYFDVCETMQKDEKVTASDARARKTMGELMEAFLRVAGID
jgi:phosphomannomutase